MPFTRRTFLEGISALPFAAGLDGSTSAGPAVHVAVIGAGAFGAWTAWHLRRRGATVTLIDAWGAGNARSSSGDESRVIRAVYGTDRIYVEMVKRAYELWEALVPSLYVETGALWLHRGDDAYVRSSAPSLAEAGFPLEKIALDEAAKRYPQIEFRGVTSVWLEHRAGALAARRGCMAVRDAFLADGGVHRIANVEPPTPANDALPSIRLGDGSRIEADAFVFACGPWLGKLFPSLLGDAIRPTRQEVYYFGGPAGTARYRAGNLPIWIDFGERIHYGIPDIDGHGFKIADDTRGGPIDPTIAERTPSADGIARARRLLAERFPELAKAPLLEARVCQYENSPDGHLIVDRHPAAKNVWIAGGGSGHGFKLSPAVGEMVASAVLSQRELPKLFSLSRLATIAKPETQFDRRQ